ncbi:MAG: hypothetical protein EBS06_06145 [Proteobacteria bacterium]|nr:hypothetical protein [Pseudomonadota bacterium]
MKKLNRIFKIICWSVLTTSLILLLAFFAFQKKSTKELSASRVALIDVVGENYIFRGNNPFVVKNGEKVFAYDELKSHFQNIVYQKNHKQLQDYYLIDISLLDLDEYYTIKKEKKFFADNSKSLGEVMNISTISPNLLAGLLPNSGITKNIAARYSSELEKNLQKIRELASQKKDKPVIIYIHCDGGRDRTGLIAAGYRMLFSDMTLSQAKSQNILEVGRSSEALYDAAINSYCLHVQKDLGKPDDYCN